MCGFASTPRLSTRLRLVVDDISTSGRAQNQVENNIILWRRAVMYLVIRYGYSGGPRRRRRVVVVLFGMTVNQKQYCRTVSKNLHARGAVFSDIVWVLWSRIGNVCCSFYNAERVRVFSHSKLIAVTNSVADTGTTNIQRLVLCSL